MSLAFNPTASIFQQEYGTKADIHYGLRVPFSRIAKAIRDGDLELHLIDNKIQTKVDEAVRVLLPNHKPDLFS